MFDPTGPLVNHAMDQVGMVLDRADLAYASVVGALAIALNARIALLAPLMVAGLEVSQLYGCELSPPLLEAVPLLAVVFLILGSIQSVVTAIAGRDAAATLLGVVIGGLVLFALWRGPTWVLRLLSRGRF